LIWTILVIEGFWLSFVALESTLTENIIEKSKKVLRHGHQDGKTLLSPLFDEKSKKLCARQKDKLSRSLAQGNYDSSSRECGHTNAFLSSRMGDQRLFSPSMHINLPITCNQQ